MKKPTITFSFPNDYDHQWDIKCHMKALDAQIAVDDALTEIRNRIKHQAPSKKEIEVLEKIRGILSAVLVDE